MGGALLGKPIVEDPLGSLMTPVVEKPKGGAVAWFIGSCVGYDDGTLLAPMVGAAEVGELGAIVGWTYDPRAEGLEVGDEL